MKRYVLAVIVFLSVGAIAQEPNLKTSDEKQADKKVESAEIGDIWRFSGAIGYNISNELEVSDYRGTQYSPYLSVTGSGSIKYQNSFLLGAFFSKLTKNKIGGLFGLNYYLNRDAKSLDFKYSDGSSTNGNVSGSTASSLESYIFDAALTYRWDLIYGLLGTNYSSYKFTPASNSSGSVSVKGSLGGYFIGVGCFFDATEKISAELQYRVEKFKLESTSSNANIYQLYDDAKLKNINLLIKYHF